MDREVIIVDSCEDTRLPLENVVKLLGMAPYSFSNTSDIIKHLEGKRAFLNPTYDYPRIYMIDHDFSGSKEIYNFLKKEYVNLERFYFMFDMSTSFKDLKRFEAKMILDNVWARYGIKSAPSWNRIFKECNIY